MNILFVCKASTEIGLGHLIRSRTLAEIAVVKHAVYFLAIGSRIANKLLDGSSFDFEVIEGEKELSRYVSKQYDAIVMDMMHISRPWFLYLKKRSLLTVSVSPVFNQMDKIDLFFNRTSCGIEEYNLAPVKRFAGLKYAVVQKACSPINSRNFKTNLQRSNLPIALSMGGGDAGNNTLRILKSLSLCRVPATFWILIGEGYNHSLDLLINDISYDKSHEIILAKTNVSAWHILNNCVLAILSGGITTYEAAYAGLPTINMFWSEDQFPLIKELIDAGVSINAGMINDDNLKMLNVVIEELYQNRNKLLEMHRSSKNLIDAKGGQRIIDSIEKEVKAAKRE
jgi:spore coat polysaccharide biosynthesis predicted glycosyltransferase SpsG